MYGLDRQKILTAAQKLQTFTADSLADYAQVSLDNVYQVLSRNKEFFESTQTKRGKRGRPITRFRVKPEQADILAREISTGRKAIGLLESMLRRNDPRAPDEDLTPDLLAAESFILDRFPEARTQNEQIEILQNASQHLTNDQRLAPAAAESPRRKIVNALWDLSCNELAVQRISNDYRLGSLYRHLSSLSTGHVLHEILPEMPNLAPDYQKEVVARLEKSSLLLSRPPRIEFLKTDRGDTTLTRVETALASEVEPCGIQLEVHDRGSWHYSPERYVSSGNSPLICIVGCNSRTQPSLPTDFFNLGIGGVTYVIDVDFRPDFRDEVLRHGCQYVPNIGSMDTESLITAMPPLFEMMDGCRAVRDIRGVIGKGAATAIRAL